MKFRMNNSKQRVQGISVLVRSMDRPTLARALDSIAAQIYQPTEIVVVAACGASHRALPAVWNDVPLRLLLPGSRLDRAAAANAGLDAATGDWLNFLDDDDELLPDHFLQLVDALEPIPKCRLAYTTTIIVREDGTTADSFGWQHHRLRLLTYPQFHMMAALFHRSLLDGGVRFDESLSICEDHDFWIQCAQHTEFKFVNKMTNRWHGFIGTSGAGVGINNNAVLVKETLSKVHQKWADLQQEWSNTLDGLLYLGRSALQDELSAEAMPFLGRALELTRDNIDSLGIGDMLFLAQHALKIGSIADALPILERALDLAPDDINCLNLGGMANFHSGNLLRAKDLLLRALEIAPGHSGIQKNVRLVEHRLSIVNRTSD
jgi:tetratricopeptide (TPR) repeat protein